MRNLAYQIIAPAQSLPSPELQALLSPHNSTACGQQSPLLRASEVKNSEWRAQIAPASAVCGYSELLRATPSQKKLVEKRHAAAGRKQNGPIARSRKRHFSVEKRAAPSGFHVFPSKSIQVLGPTGSPPGPTRVHLGPFFSNPHPVLGSNLIHSDVGPMHGSFDHEPVFSVVVQIIFQTGACGLEVSHLLNERKDCMDSSQRTGGTTASCTSHKNVTDTGKMQATTSRLTRHEKLQVL